LFALLSAETTVAPPPVGQVPTTEELMRQSTSAFSSVVRHGVKVAGDAPDETFVSGSGPCPQHGGHGDVGSCVPSSDGRSWLARPAGDAWLASEFGVAITASAADNTTALNNMTAAACALPPHKWLVDVASTLTAVAATRADANGTANVLNLVAVPQALRPGLYYVADEKRPAAILKGVMVTAQRASAVSLSAPIVGDIGAGDPITLTAAIPMNGMISCSGADGEFVFGAWLSMRTTGFGFQLLPAVEALPSRVATVKLTNISVHQNRFHGSAIMLQGLNNATIEQPRWDGVALGSYTYNDGVGQGEYHDAGLTLKGIANTGTGPWHNIIINPSAFLPTGLRTNGCAGNTLSFNSVAGIYDGEGTVYAVDYSRKGLPLETTVVSHTATTVTLSKPCSQVTKDDKIYFTTAARNVLMVTTTGQERTSPSPILFIGGQFTGANTNIDDFIGGRNQFIGVDVGEGCHGISIGGSGRFVATDLIDLAYGEAEACDKVHLTRDARFTLILQTGGSSGTKVDISHDGDVGTIVLVPGRINLGTLPSSCRNLPAGTLWSDVNADGAIKQCH
jgi:hypothetical protein